MENAPFWPLGFFYKGLVIHVVFSLVIWLMGIFAFLVSVATLKLSGGDMRAAAARADRAGRHSRRFPMPVRARLPRRDPAGACQLRSAHSPSGLRFRAHWLWRSAFSRRSCVSWSICRGGWRRPPPLAIAMALAGFIYILALACFAIAGTLLAREGELAWSRDGAVLGRRTCAAIRLRRPHVDQLVDPRALEPRREGGRQPRLPASRSPGRR